MWIFKSPLFIQFKGESDFVDLVRSYILLPTVAFLSKPTVPLTNFGSRGIVLLKAKADDYFNGKANCDFKSGGRRVY